MRATTLVLLAFVAGCSDDPAAAGGETRDAAADTLGGDGGPNPSDGGGDGAAAAKPPIVGVRDRAGRPFVSLLLVSAPNREEYNRDPVDFVLPTDPMRDGGTTFGADFQTALVRLDSLDGKSDWNGGAADAGPDDAGVYPHPLTNGWLTVDALIVDPNKPFSPTGYLDVEVNPTTHATCGGRWLADDALDKTMSYLVAKSLTGVSDGVSAPAKAPSMTLPYLAEPF